MLLGLFDSGTGGLNTVRYIKESYPEIDLVYHIDRENAPYGTKSSEELVRLSEICIDSLLERGAEAVLIACCTAGTVYPLLSDKHRRMSLPIIEATAEAAKRKTKNRKIGLIATDRTCISHAFDRALGGYEVISSAAQELVKRIDNGLSDLTADKDDIEYLTAVLSPIWEQNADTLILGCTHFPALEDTVTRLSREHGAVNIISSVKAGADLLCKQAIKNIS